MRCKVAMVRFELLGGVHQSLIQLGIIHQQAGGALALVDLVRPTGSGRGFRPA